MLADKDQFAGVMVIQHDGRTVYSEVLGEADRRRHIPNTMETRFRIGSMNKMFTAVATLQLVAAGKLQLNAPIALYLPDYPNKDAAALVTVRHLLTRTGGSGDFFEPEFDARRTLLGELNLRNIDSRAFLSKVDAPPRRTRGASAPGKFGGDPQTRLDLRSMLCRP